VSNCLLQAIQSWCSAFTVQQADYLTVAVNKLSFVLLAGLWDRRRVCGGKSFDTCRRAVHCTVSSRVLPRHDHTATPEWARLLQD